MNFKPLALLTTAACLSLAPLIHAAPLPPVAPVPPVAPTSEMPCCTGTSITVRGDFAYYTTAAPLQDAGVFPPDWFKKEIYGSAFSVAISGLPAGKYTVEIDLAEQYQQAVGARVMDIAVGTQRLAENYDIFAAAGGRGKATRVIGSVEHRGDAQGPLTISFTAKADKAKFNAIRILDADGQVLAGATAAQIEEQETAFATAIPTVKTAPIYLDARRPRLARVNDLISRMALSEKVAQLQNDAPAIERLKVPRYNYWNEALHGVARAGTATVFPQAIGMAATWDTTLIHSVADVVSTEARAKYAEAQARGDFSIYHGLTFWTPNINIYRDPRWGRGQETYGEDPFLTSRFGVAFITGLQGNNPNTLKTAACAKHFAVHSGPESSRHSFNALPSQTDLYNTYLPAFEAAVREAKVASVMSAYNAINGVPAPANTFLLQNILRDKWGFTGHVVSDCGAINDVSQGHKYAQNFEEAASLSIKAGTDLECGASYSHLIAAVKQGLITEPEIDRALRRVLDVRLALGLFDGPSTSAYARIPASENDTPAHAQVALQTAREALVLLKNDGVLPLERAKIKTLAVIGANADARSVLLGNYNGEPSHPITVLQGLRDHLGQNTRIITARGCALALRPGEAIDENAPDFVAALDAARQADAVIYVGGLSPQLEGEEMRVSFEGFSGGDRTQIELPAIQTHLLQALQATGKPLVFVNCSGGAVAMPWEAANVGAILQVWYPGQSGGTAVAQTLFGESNPSGRLPVTFYRATSDLPAFEDYSMKNRTYRYFGGQAQWAFGHGLSYTTWSYGPLRAARNASASGPISVRVLVSNKGMRDGAEVVQLYARRLGAGNARSPLHTLVSFRRVPVARGANTTVDLSFPASRLRLWDEKKGAYVVAKGRYELQVGGASDDVRQKAVVEVK